MGILELLFIAVGLSMDAFAVSIGKGLSVCRVKMRHSLSVGMWFGGFQALMPLIGFYLGNTFASAITSFDHWVAFLLLGIIGGNMIRESLTSESDEQDPDFSTRNMLMLAIATSIDALAMGVTFAFFNVNIWEAIFIIGIITFGLSVIGLKIGNIFGCRYKRRAEFVGGAILILMGLKILLDHLIL